MTFVGLDGIITRVVYRYQPCHAPQKTKQLTYQQHRRYLLEVEKIGIVVIPGHPYIVGTMSQVFYVDS